MHIIIFPSRLQLFFWQLFLCTLFDVVSIPHLFILSIHSCYSHFLTAHAYSIIVCARLF
jgi:hypothetical protein